MQSRWDVPWGSPSRPNDNANLRIGDAERNEISDLLSKHYSDGRLDAAEFQERLDRAMSAKTRADLSGLLVDLPRLQTPEQHAAVAVPPRRPRVLRVVLFAVLAFWVLSIGAAVARGFWWFGWIHIPWLLIGLIALFLWSRDRRHRHWRYRREFLDERPQ
ncbi:MAG: DUF1707 domain-containing protein [Acidimicrobiales bacterium]|jgi:hypothetical protein